MICWFRRVERKLDDALALLTLILQKEEQQMAAIDDLEAQVAETDGAMESATTLLQGILSRLDQAGTDPTKLAALKNDLKAHSDALAAAVAAVPPPPTT